MADNEYFPVGTILSCTMCNGRKIQGEVMAFDHTTKVLAIKSQSTNSKATHNDVHFVNMNLVNDGEITIIKEATEPAPPISNLNLPKIQQRLQQNLEEKCRKANYIGKGVSPLAQKLFHHITKTTSMWALEVVNFVDSFDSDHCVFQCRAVYLLQCIYKSINEVRWDGHKIIVMDQVEIVPPYESENVHGKEGSHAIQHVKKLVDKYHRDEKRESSVSSNSSSS